LRWLLRGTRTVTNCSWDGGVRVRLSSHGLSLVCRREEVGEAEDRKEKFRAATRGKSVDGNRLDVRSKMWGGTSCMRFGLAVSLLWGGCGLSVVPCTEKSIDCYCSVSCSRCCAVVLFLPAWYLFLSVLSFFLGFCALPPTDTVLRVFVRWLLTEVLPLPLSSEHDSLQPT
jgi:hypothetical protein